MTERYYNEEGKISTEENAVVKLVAEQMEVRAYLRKERSWDLRWTAKNVELGDIRIVKGGSSIEKLKKELKKKGEQDGI